MDALRQESENWNNLHFAALYDSLEMVQKPGNDLITLFDQSGKTLHQELNTVNETMWLLVSCWKKAAGRIVRWPIKTAPAT
jgi:hypothetical protein